MIALEQNMIYSGTILDYMFDSNQASTVPLSLNKESSKYLAMR